MESFKYSNPANTFKHLENPTIKHYSEQKNENSYSLWEKRQIFENAVSRLSSFNEKKTEKLENKRKEQLISEIRSLQDRPHISENSKKIFKNYIPIYKRLNEIVKQKHEYKKNLQLESELAKNSLFRKNCTFKPNSSGIITRTPEEFAEDTFVWKQKKDQLQEKLVQEKQNEIQAKHFFKPQISKKSLMLSVSRSLTPVFSRLYEKKERTEENFGDFRPCVTPEANKLTSGKRNKVVFERLYSLRKICQSSGVDVKLKIKKQKSAKLLGDGKYKINSQDAPIFDVPVNFVPFSASSKFLLSALLASK